MFIPLHDANDLKYIKTQHVTLLLLAANIGVFLYMWLAASTGASLQESYVALGFIPAVVNDLAELDPALVMVPEDVTYVTYSFMHANWLHLGSNMLFLWVFGDNIEDALGHVRYLFFYFACAIAGAFVHGVVFADSDGPLIGASGAVAGIVAAYLILHPRVRLWVLAFGKIPLPLPAFIPLGVWIIVQFLLFFTEIGGTVSWAAHVGGILAGAVLVVVLRRDGVPLFDRRIVTPRAVVEK